jgi:hypothetical protein
MSLSMQFAEVFVVKLPGRSSVNSLMGYPTDWPRRVTALPEPAQPAREGNQMDTMAPFNVRAAVREPQQFVVRLAVG